MLHLYYTASTSTQISSLHSAAGHCYKRLSSSFEVLGRCSQESNLSVPDHCILWKKKILFFVFFFLVVVVVIRQKSIWSQEVKVPNSLWNFSAFAKWYADTDQRRPYGTQWATSTPVECIFVDAFVCCEVMMHPLYIQHLSRHVMHANKR